LFTGRVYGLVHQRKVGDQWFLKVGGDWCLTELDDPWSAEPALEA
jgi:hypothetical protein